jgi:hypothetical protein
MVARAGVAAKFSFLVHSHMLRHACGFKLANDGHDTRAQPAPLPVTVARHIPGCASHFATRRPAKPLKPGEQQGRRLLYGRQRPSSMPISICSPR